MTISTLTTTTNTTTTSSSLSMTCDTLYVQDYTEEMLFDYVDSLDMENVVNENDTIDVDKINQESSSNTINVGIDINKNKMQCRLCKKNDGVLIIEGKVTCSLCGLVISMKLENSIENNNYGEGSNYHDGYTLISTNLSHGYINTNIIGSNPNNLMNKLNMWNNTMNTDEKNVHTAFKRIHEICFDANLSKKIEDTAKIMYLNLKQCKEPKILNKNNKIQMRKKINCEKKKNTMIAVCIKEACINNNNTCNSHEIAKFCQIDLKELTKGEKFYAKLTRDSVKELKSTNVQAHDFIPRLCEKLNMEKKVIEYIQMISNNVEKLSICSNATPQTIAATIIYIVVNIYKLPIRLNQISTLAYISEGTIDKCYDKIIPYISIITNNNKTNALYEDLIYVINQMSPPKKFIEMVNEINSMNINTLT